MNWRWALWDALDRSRGEPSAALYLQLERSQWDPAETRRISEQRLGKVLRHAKAHCAAYQHLGTPTELRDFPILTKAMLREMGQDYAAAGFTDRSWSQSSGGSTGEPTRVLIDHGFHAWRTATGWRGDCFGGLAPTDCFCLLWGHPTDKSQAAGLRGRLREWLHNRYLQDVFHLSPQRVREIHRAMQRLRPRAIVGYASALLTYARLATELGLPAPHVLKVIPTAETCTPEQAAQISAYFQAPALQRYGAREVGDIAHQCEQGHWHIHCEHAKLEVQLSDGNIRETGRGKLLVSCLSNLAMPLIRYEIGDEVDLNPVPCSCGRALPTFSSLLGRSADVIRLPDGTALNSLLFNHLVKDYPVRQFRVVQESATLLNLLIVPEKEYEPADSAALLEKLREQIGPGIELALQLVNDLAPLPSGKLRQVVALPAQAPLPGAAASAAPEG